MGLERPRGSFDLILGQFLQVVVIVFCCFPTFSEESGWGVGVGGSTVSEITLLSTKTFSASQPLTGTVRTCFATWIRTWSLTTERVWVRVGSLSALAFLHSPCTCLFSLSLCTSLFALHSVLTLQSAFFVCFLRTSLRRMSFEMIGFGDDAHSAEPGSKVLDLLFSSLFSHRFLE